MRLALALSFLASPTFAACPTASDMQKGILFTLDDGGTELHRVTRRDWVEIFAVFSDGEASLLDFYHGLYLKADVPVVNGMPQIRDTQTYATETQLQAWPPPSPNASWANNTPGGGVAQSGAVTTIELGDCKYDAYDIRIVFADDLSYSETYQYLPELKTGLLVATSDEEGTERYRYTSIQVNQ